MILFFIFWEQRCSKRQLFGGVHKALSKETSLDHKKMKLIVFREGRLILFNNFC